MPCFHPWQAFRKIEGKGVTVHPRAGYTDKPVTLPCSQCLGCRMDRSRDWSTRLVHEASQHRQNCFLTLTYNDANLPDDYSVSVREMQTFLKRLRKAVGRVRFFACGEYGDKGLRPHYHLALFGYDFPDKRVWRRSAAGYLCWRSDLLEALWPKGHAEIGELNLKSAAYVARYIMKKVNGEAAYSFYQRVHPLTGEICQVTPEFITMSTRPGIGRAWYEQYASDTFPSDYVIVDGKRVPVPRYYTKQLEEEQRDGLATERIKKAKKHAANNTPDRLEVREEIQRLKTVKLKRDLE